MGSFKSVIVFFLLEQDGYFSLTLFSEITIIGRGSCQRNPGMETFNAFKGSKMGFLFVEFVYFFVKER